MKNMKKLRSELADVFSKLKSGELDTKVAVELNNSAGKIINSVKVEIEYATARNELPNIAFMKDDNE